MRKLLFACLVLVVVVIGLLHFYTPGYLVFYHDTYRRLSYFPIVLGAVWFGARGGIFLAALSSVAFIPHVLLYLGQGPSSYLSELTEIVLYLAAGAVTGIIAGREKKLREKYRLLSEKLERSYDRLHKETQLLLEVEEQLSASQKLSALGRLSASLAHEIKNPLASIKGTAEILLDEFPGDHPKREFVEILLTESSRLNNTVEEVLQFSRGDRDRRLTGGGRESLAGVVNRVMKLLDGQLRTKDIQLTATGVEAAADFPVDGDKLAQVFLNIILNAVEVLPRQGKIRITVSGTAEGVEVAVSDNGPGIPEADREMVFAPFYSRKEEGTGLGLPISRKIVESYGGRLSISDSETGGARFTVFLPQRRELELLEPEAHSRGSRGGHSSTGKGETEDAGG